MPVRRVHADADPSELVDQLAEAHPNMLGPHVVTPEQLRRLVTKLIEQKKMERLEEEQKRQQQMREELIAEDLSEEDSPPRTAAAMPPSRAPAPVRAPAPLTESRAAVAPSASTAMPARAARSAGPLDALDSLDTLTAARKPAPQGGMGSAPQGGMGSAIVPDRCNACSALHPAGRGVGAASSETGASATRQPAGSSGAGAASVVVDGDKDLNKVGEEELQQIKGVMNVRRPPLPCPLPRRRAVSPPLARSRQVGFEKNQLKPGDPGYEYDKRVDFEGDKESNDWDDEIEDVRPPPRPPRRPA